MIYLITHGERHYGPDPVHTGQGLLQIQSLREHLKNLKINLIVVGTGRRFCQIYEQIRPSMNGIPVKRSPLCGSADGLEKNGCVVLTDGTIVPPKMYVSIIDNPFIDIWGFVNNLPDGTLLCSGGELMIALGFSNINQKGHLYEIDPEKRSCEMLA